MFKSHCCPGPAVHCTDSLISFRAGRETATRIVAWANQSVHA